MAAMTAVGRYGFEEFLVFTMFAEHLIEVGKVRSAAE
jgi:hypothetical protein